MSQKRKAVDELLNVDELAVFLNVSIRTVWRQDKEEKIPAPCRFGRLKRWSKADIKLWLEFEKPSRKIFEILKQKGLA
jgi:predicted DNA-binding transcriptional regulator AlpA